MCTPFHCKQLANVATYLCLAGFIVAGWPALMTECLMTECSLY